MNDRLPSVPLVMFWFDGLFVMYHVPLMTASPPLIVSKTRVVPSITWPQPPGTPAGAQSSPPGTPPWKMSNGWMNERVSPVQGPVTPW